MHWLPAIPCHALRLTSTEDQTGQAELFWHYSGIILALFWHYSGIILALFWHYSGKGENRINGDGTVTDQVTGLIWQQSPDLNQDGEIDLSDELACAQALDYEETGFSNLA